MTSKNIKKPKDLNYPKNFEKRSKEHPTHSTAYVIDTALGFSLIDACMVCEEAITNKQWNICLFFMAAGVAPRGLACFTAKVINFKTLYPGLIISGQGSDEMELVNFKAAHLCGQVLLKVAALKENKEAIKLLTKCGDCVKGMYLTPVKNPDGTEQVLQERKAINKEIFVGHSTEDQAYFDGFASKEVVSQSCIAMIRASRVLAKDFRLSLVDENYEITTTVDGNGEVVNTKKLARTPSFSALSTSPSVPPAAVSGSTPSVTSSSSPAPPPPSSTSSASKPITTPSTPPVIPPPAPPSSTPPVTKPTITEEEEEETLITTTGVLSLEARAEINASLKSVITNTGAIANKELVKNQILQLSAQKDLTKDEQKTITEANKKIGIKSKTFLSRLGLGA